MNPKGKIRVAVLYGGRSAEHEVSIQSAKNIIEKKGCEAIVVSMGASGALLVTKDIIQQVAAPPVKMKSSVGAGDCMVAGIALSLLNGRNIKEAVRYGVACGTASTLNEGTSLCNLDDVESLYSFISEHHRDMIVDFAG